mgnify:CR=1 FL=1
MPRTSTPLRIVVPVAGEGTRLRPLTRDRPKALVEVAGEPLLARLLQSVVPVEPEEVVLVVPRRGGGVEERFGAGFRGIPLRYAVQDEPTGLADAVLAARPLVEGPFMVVQGDNVLRADLRAAAERFRRETPDALVLTEEVSPREARQAVCLTDGHGRLRRIVEHPGAAEREAGRIVAGVMLFSTAVFDACRRVEPSEEGERELTDAVNLLLEREDARVATMPLPGRRVNVNTPDDLRRAEALVAGGG